MSRQKQQELKNQDEDIYDIESDDEEYDTTLNLSRQNLRAIPYKIAKQRADDVHTLILTKNKLSSFHYLSLFSSLTTLQLDGNDISDDLFSYFPPLKCLHTLWLNNNNLRNLDDLLRILRTKCPKLEYLSLLFNPLCPFTADGGSHYMEYRDKVLSQLQSLKYLDILGKNRCNSDELQLLDMIDVNLECLASCVLTESHMKRIISHCATITHFVEWRCFYNTSCDGFSRNNFFNEIAKINEEKSLLILRDTMNHVFGAYIDDARWLKSLHYKGSIDCFVFHFGGTYTEYNDNLYIHKATGLEPYYLQFNNKNITIGCGEAAAIFFDMEFTIGRTQYCKTFDSPPLTQTANTQFVIQSIEIWAPLLSI